ncbi:MAG: hypothetical protein GY711_26705 [bacterium]|nr:hypothetical protein [bacterium]
MPSLPTLTLGAVAVVLLALVPLERRATASSGPWLDGVRELLALDAHLNEQALETRFGLVGHYDELVDCLARMEQVFTDLASCTPYGGSDTVALVARARRAFDDKRTLIEDFKSANAVLGSSKHYFPSAVERALSRAEAAGVDGRTLRVIVDTLHTALGDARTERDLDEVLERLSRDSPNVPILGVHARNLAAYRVATDAVLLELLRSPVERILTRLEAHLYAHVRQAARRTERERAVAYVVAGFLLLHALWAWAGLRRTSRDLREANVGLESRIAERTHELSHAKRELELMVQDLERTNAELSELNEVAAHDLQEPVRRLVSFSELLKDDLGDDLPERAEKDLEFIVSGAWRLKELVADLLALSKVGRVPARLSAFPLGDCVAHARSALAEDIERARARVEADELCAVTADRNQLQELFVILIGNAIKFTKEEAPRIRVTHERRVGFDVFGVADNGIGIAPEHAGRIFAPFRRLHHQDELEGTGMGLAIARKIVERHRGTLWVEPAHGGGCHFRFTLEPPPTSAAAG